MEKPSRRVSRKVAFWTGVAAVAVGANFLAEFIVETLASKTKAPAGLARLVAYTHKGVA